MLFRIILLFFFYFCFESKIQNSSYRPTVLWHGMGDTCCYSFSMGAVKNAIEKVFGRSEFE
jgi:palmitoyl-protein thioesterase